MKFKKRNLTEEIGLPRSNKKTFTKNKKQKVRITETQLQRLLGIISEQNVNTPGAPNPKDYKKGGQDPKYLADKKAFLKKYKAKKGKPKPRTTGGPTPPPAPNFNMSTWSPGFKKKVDTFLKNKNIKGAERFLKGKVDGWKKKTMKAGPKWKKQLKAKTDFAMKLMKDVEKAKATTKKPLNEAWGLLWKYIKYLMDNIPAGGGGDDKVTWNDFKTQHQSTFRKLGNKAPNSFEELKRMGKKSEKQLKEQRIIGYVCHHGACTGVNSGSFQYQSMQACQAAGCGTLGSPVQGGDLSIDEPMVDFSTNKPQTSPVKKMCCRDRNGVITSAVNGRCPKSSTKVPCKGTPPTQGTIATENRTLKTTNPITESEIKDMKKWFNRVDKSGREYNPSKL